MKTTSTAPTTDIARGLPLLSLFPQNLRPTFTLGVTDWANSTCFHFAPTEDDKDETEIHVKTNPSDFVVSLELSAAAFAEVWQHSPSHTHACAHTYIER